MPPQTCQLFREQTEGARDEENNLQSIVGTRRKEENIPEKTSSRQTVNNKKKSKQQILEIYIETLYIVNSTIFCTTNRQINSYEIVNEASLTLRNHSLKKRAKKENVRASLRTLTDVLEIKFTATGNDC